MNIYIWGAIAIMAVVVLIFSPRIALALLSRGLFKPGARR
jgi:hypothetical protein